MPYNDTGPLQTMRILFISPIVFIQRLGGLVRSLVLISDLRT